MRKDEKRRAEIVQALWFQGALIELNLPQGCTVQLDEHGSGEIVTVKFTLEGQVVASCALERWPLYGGVSAVVRICHNIIQRPPTTIKINDVQLERDARAILPSGGYIAVAPLKAGDNEYAISVTTFTISKG